MREGLKPCGMVVDFTYIEEGWICLIIVTIESGSGEIVKLYCETREKYSKVSNRGLVISQGYNLLLRLLYQISYLLADLRKLPLNVLVGPTNFAGTFEVT